MMNTHSLELSPPDYAYRADADCVDLDAPNQFLFMAWIKGPLNAGDILTRQRDDDPDGTGHFPTGGVWFGIGDPTGTTQSHFFASYNYSEGGIFKRMLGIGPVIPEDTWTHVAVRYLVNDGTGNMRMYFYLNGAPDTNVGLGTTASGFFPSGINDTDLVVGAHMNKDNTAVESGSEFTGFIDEIYFDQDFGGGDADAFVAAHYNKSIQSGGSVLYHFNNDLLDYSGNDNNLTNSGTSFSTDKPFSDFIPKIIVA